MAATRDVPGINTTFQIVQHIQIGTVRSRTQDQYILVGLDRRGFSNWANKLALLALQYFGMEFSFIALIGIILLMDIVKKNAIIMIDFALDAERHRA